MSRRYLPKPLLIWNRSKERIDQQLIPRELFLRWSYESVAGTFCRKTILTRPFFSWFFGFFANTGWSRQRIPPFIQQFNIPIEEYEDVPYLNFNDFFTRRFKPKAREFHPDSHILPAFSEGSYVGFDKIDSDIFFPVKGAYLSTKMILGGKKQCRWFIGGPLLIVRLFPTDYHRFHYPDSGWTLEEYLIHGALHSINPISLGYQPNIFAINERRVSLLKTQNFGRLAYIEIGSMGMGRIVHSHSSRTSFERGDEKGYFLLGGSTIILMGEPGAWIPSADILEQTRLCRETRIKLGQEVARLL